MSGFHEVLDLHPPSVDIYPPEVDLHPLGVDPNTDIHVSNNHNNELGSSGTLEPSKEMADQGTSSGITKNEDGRHRSCAQVRPNVHNLPRVIRSRTVITQDAGEPPAAAQAVAVDSQECKQKQSRASEATEFTQTQQDNPEGLSDDSTTAAPHMTNCERAFQLMEETKHELKKVIGAEKREMKRLENIEQDNVELKGQIRHLLRKKSQKEKRLNELESQRVEIADKARKLEEKRAEVTARARELEEERNTQSADKARQLEVMAEKERLLDVKLAEIADNARKLEEWRTESAGKARQLEQKQTDIADKEQQLEQKRIDMADGERQLDEKRSQMAKQARQLETLREGKADTARQLLEKQAEMAYKGRQLDEKHAQMAAQARKLEQERAYLAYEARKLAEQRAHKNEARKIDKQHVETADTYIKFKEEESEKVEHKNISQETPTQIVNYNEEEKEEEDDDDEEEEEEENKEEEEEEGLDTLYTSDVPYIGEERPRKIRYISDNYNKSIIDHLRKLMPNYEIEAETSVFDTCILLNFARALNSYYINVVLIGTHDVKMRRGSQAVKNMMRMSSFVDLDCTIVCQIPPIKTDSESNEYRDKLNAAISSAYPNHVKLTKLDAEHWRESVVLSNGYQMNERGMKLMAEAIAPKTLEVLKSIKGKRLKMRTKAEEEDLIVKSVLIPPGITKHVVGKGGATIIMIQRKNDVEIISGHQRTNGDSMMTITGKSEKVMKAKAEINEIILEKLMEEQQMSNQMQSGKQRIECTFFKAGKCKYGDRCHNSHALHDARRHKEHKEERRPWRPNKPYEHQSRSDDSKKRFNLSRRQKYSGNRSRSSDNEDPQKRSRSRSRSRFRSRSRSSSCDQSDSDSRSGRRSYNSTQRQRSGRSRYASSDQDSDNSDASPPRKKHQYDK